MVWRNSNKKINIKNFMKVKVETISNLKVNNKKKILTSDNTLKELSVENELRFKSGIKHSINTVTGNKVRDWFINRISKRLDLGLLTIKNKKLSKKSIEFKKKFYLRDAANRRRHILFKKSKKILKLDLIQNKPVKASFISSIKDNARLKANQDLTDFKYQISKNFTKSKYIPSFNNQKWNLLFSNSIIVDSQESYLQSNIHRIDKNVIENETLERLLLDSMVISPQRSLNFNNFIRQLNYKNLLFRSFWFNKFITTLVKCGKKQKVWSFVLNSMSSLKIECGRNPVLILFEILELYRMPIKGLNPKSLTRKVVVRTHLVSWWKQYTQILRWLRHSFLGQNKNHISWKSRIKHELYNLIFEIGNTLVKKRIEANSQLIAFGRVAIHFRWHRRYSKRAVRSIKVLDKKFYH